MTQLKLPPRTPTDTASAWLLRALEKSPHTWRARPLSGVEISFPSGTLVRVSRGRLGPPTAPVLDRSGFVTDAWPVTSREQARHVARELQVREGVAA